MTEKEIREKAIETATKIWNDGNLSKQECIEMLGANLIKAHRQGRVEGLREARKAGPDGCLFGGGTSTCELHKEYKCEGCSWWNDALDAKNAAIDSLLSQPDGSGGEGKKV